MAVNYANALAEIIDGSYLCCTRREGLLKKKISYKVKHLFLERKNTLDLKAVSRLRKFVKRNQIDVIQAHGNSWFIAILVKLSLWKLKLVWHDHWGERALANYKPGPLKLASLFFDGVISVNSSLEKWASENLMTKKTITIENFVPSHNFKDSDEIRLKGPNIFDIVHVANLKYPKDHLTLLGAIKILKDSEPGISLHLIGKDENDIYSREVKNFISQHSLHKNVFFYGEQENISAFLEKAQLGVLSSVSEGFPLVLLEYGIAGLPVVSTKVGACADILGETGVLVPASEPMALAAGIEHYMNDRQLMESCSRKFSHRILENYSEVIIMEKVLNLFDSIIREK